MAANQSDPSNFYKLFHKRDVVVEIRPRLKEKRRRRKRIMRQRAYAYDVHGCEDMAERCTFPECFCYPYWKKEYREKVAIGIPIVHEEDE